METLVCGSSYIVVDFPRARGGGDACRGGCFGALAGVSGELRPGRSHQLELRRDGRAGMGGDPNDVPAAIESYRCQVGEGDALDLLRPREFQIFRQAGESKPVELIDEGRHGFAALRRVPVFRVEGSEGLWLTNKAALLQLEHFNKSNALSWALTMGLFATPVIYSDGNGTRLSASPITSKWGRRTGSDGRSRRARSTRSRRTIW